MVRIQTRAAEPMDLTVALSASHSSHILQMLKNLGGTVLGMEVIQGLLVIPVQITTYPLQCKILSDRTIQE